MTESTNQWRARVVCLLLTVAVMNVFWPALSFSFVHFDDPAYILNNHQVQQGLNWPSIKWAFTSETVGNWHPLTSLSHILDCQLYGLEAPGHHLSSLLWHLGSSLLLFLVLSRMTGALWPSAFVAAMFALHPLRVESVVWVSERKDVMSTFFWILTIGAYVRYAEQVKLCRTGTLPNVRSMRGVFYGLSLFFFVLGLLSKPMLVTLPFVLLLLDYWPLGRLEPGSVFCWRLVVEKIPFFVLAVGDSVVALVAQRHAGAIATLTTLPLSIRVANVPFAYCWYIWKNFWPSGLAPLYPHRPLGVLEVAGALGFMAAISVLVVRFRRSQPWLAVGWFWFLGTLVPTIGLVQVGTQAYADRYTYIPSIGLWVMLAWWVGAWVKGRQLPRAIAVAGGMLAVLACVVLTPLQERYWQNTATLYVRAAGVTDHQYQAYYNLACFYMEHGDYPKAIQFFKRALDSPPDASGLEGRATAFNNLGFAYLREGELTNAVINLQEAVAMQPRYPEAFYNLGVAFLNNNQPALAADGFERALALDPKLADAHYKLANAFSLLDRNAEAIAQYSNALDLRPGMDEAANNLAWLLATCPDRSLRDGAKALALARQASEHTRGLNPVTLGTLAAAYAETGKTTEAIATLRRALQLAQDQRNAGLTGMLESQLRQYEGGGGAPP